VFDTITDTEVFAQTPKVQAWRATLEARTSVVDAVMDNYAARLRDFLIAHDAWLLKRAA
jgi:glutathione S-transferase